MAAFPEQVAVTLAEPGDAAAILALQKLAFLDEAELYQDFAIAPLTQTLAEMERDMARLTVLKATVNGKIVGSVRGKVEGAVGCIGRLVVAPEFRRKGLGTRLMQEMERRLAPRCELLEIFTGHRSLSNIRLYERLGYATARTESVSPALSLVFMRKASPRL